MLSRGGRNHAIPRHGCVTTILWDTTVDWGMDSLTVRSSIGDWSCAIRSNWLLHAIWASLLHTVRSTLLHAIWATLLHTIGTRLVTVRRSGTVGTWLLTTELLRSKWRLRNANIASSLEIRGIEWVRLLELVWGALALIASRLSERRSSRAIQIVVAIDFWSRSSRAQVSDFLPLIASFADALSLVEIWHAITLIEAAITTVSTRAQALSVLITLELTALETIELRATTSVIILGGLRGCHEHCSKAYKFHLEFS